MAWVRRFIGPFLGFSAGAGLQLSGWHNLNIAIGIWSFAAVWGLIALITWQPFQRACQKVWQKTRRLRVTFAPISIECQSQTAFLNLRDDAAEHLLVLGRDFSALTISRGIAGWPIGYPVKLHNTRPVSIEVVGYTVIIFLNSIPIQVVEWNSPANHTSNGIAMSSSFYLLPDDLTPFTIPVVLAQMQTSLPEVSPFWGASGQLRIQGDSQIITRDFDFTNDNRTFSQEEWDKLRNNAILDKG